MPTNFTSMDHAHMARALRLAERGLCTTQPNPRVGCVVAQGEAVLGEGWHQRAGEPHAEVFALREAGTRARGATAYVTLEPCSHFGRTPPCADALVAAGIARVVAACEDPNPRVAGEGLRRLRDAGIVVETGLMQAAARELNRGFFSRIERQRPWVRVKLAMSLDGRTALANGASKWITGEAARADVQRWRARSSAILTGIGTVLVDNPRLTVRLDQQHPHPSSPLEGEGVKPLRVVLDRELRTPRGALVLDGSAPTLIVHGDGSRPQDDRFAHVELAPMPLRDERPDLAAVLTFLAGRDVNEAQVEAGPTLCGALFAMGLVDELLLYVAPVLLGEQARPLLMLPAIDTIATGRRLRIVDQRRIGEDQRLLLRE
jgi:diaminohydroxyphosphoribosylaminopyrimidine deaminase/5-amino-6-(5-phosphoribosylamino)uracil reductase